MLKHPKILKGNFASLCDLFSLQVKTTPNAIAAIFEGESLTYEELNYRSSQLAGSLKENGVKSETIVALSLHNSLDLLIGILGILKSGGAYLPVDPNYPAERINSILDDAKPLIMLTAKSLMEKYSHLSCKIIPMQDRPFVESCYLEEPIQPNQLAYVIYTSGSTGKPKGIMVEHQSLSHAAQVFRELHPDKLVSLMSGSISFDASLLVISLTLSSGGTVCIPRNERIIDPGEIITLIERHKVNYTLCVPSFYAMLLNKSQKLLSLQSIDLGGETIPNGVPAMHADMAPNAILHNVYGPSEYAIGATFAKIYDPVSKQNNKISIGKSLPNTEVYILDENLQSVSIGVKGEIFIGGDGLARGYLNKEALSKERFMWVSFPNQKPIRLYRTGDFGLFLPDGNIEFLGRVDHQVKIRGYRIELGEIEDCICQYPEVNEAVVIAKESLDRHKCLEAYFSSRAKESIVEKLRVHLQNALPKYMIPPILVQVDTWPLTPNGKIDRAALGNSFEPGSLEFPYGQLLSGLERKLFEIWMKVLGRDKFGVNDNFFDLGGDSILIVSMQSLLEKVLGYKIHISDLFQYPTISQLVNYLSSRKSEEAPCSKFQKLSKKQKSAFQQFKKNCR